MQYAREVIELMGPYPGREFRMSDIVRYIVGQRPDKRKRNAVREAVRAVLKQLENSKSIEVRAGKSFHLYVWLAEVPD